MREEVPNIAEGGADLLAHLVIYTAERRVNVNRFRSAQPTAAPARTNHVRVCNSPLPSRPAPGSRRASAPILRRGALAPPPRPCQLTSARPHPRGLRPKVRALPDTALPRLSDFFGSPDHVSPSSVTAASLASANAAGDAPAPPEAVDPPPEAVSLSEAKPDSLLADETLTSSSGDGSAHAVKQMKKRKRTLRAS